MQNQAEETQASLNPQLGSVNWMKQVSLQLDLLSFVMATKIKKRHGGIKS